MKLAASTARHLGASDIPHHTPSKFLAVDVGGTSTRAVVVEPDGTCVGYGKAGSGNPTSSGTDMAVSSVVAAARAAMTQAASPPTDIASGVIGIAGATAESGAWLLVETARRGLPGTLTLEADLLVAYFAGSLEDDGYAVVAGTGAAAIRVRGGTIEATCDGIGWLLGDAGSGFWIGHRVALAATSALDGRGPATVLTDRFMSQLGVDPIVERGPNGRGVALDHIVRAIYELRPVELARFAPLAFEAAAQGDDVSLQIVADAGDALATTLAAVVAPDVDGPVVLGGSILSQQPTVAERVARSFHATKVVTVSDGLPGAAVLALRDGGVFVDELVFDRIHSSLATLR